MNVYIDGTHSFCTAKSTGIERVVRRLADGLEALPAEMPGMSARRVIVVNQKFFEVDNSISKWLRRFARFEANAASQIPLFARRALECWPKGVGGENVRSVLLPGPSHLGGYNIPFRVVQRSVIRFWAACRKPVSFQSGDFLLMADAYWGKRNVWSVVQKAKEKGASVATVFYDMIPITHVDFVGYKRSLKFRKYLGDIVTNSDLILAISNTVRNQLCEYLSNSREYRQISSERIQSFRLGADVSHLTGEVRQKVRDYFEPNMDCDGTRPYLVVGTLDPRKNHMQVIDAVEQLADRGFKRKVCFVGRAGGLSDALIERMGASKLAGKLLDHWDDFNDIDLQYAYRNCEAVLMPSVVEGFGLPIVEALWHSAKVLASDIPIHREVGGNRCEYFRLHDPKSLADLILMSEKVPKLDLKSNAHVTSWRESAMEVLAKRTQMDSRRRAA
ncbi:glycosyltransferase family 4 protein [Pirellulaceae bacterium SH501]